MQLVARTMHGQRAPMQVQHLDKRRDILTVRARNGTPRINIGHKGMDMYVHMYVYTCIHIYTQMHICIYIYIYV